MENRALEIEKISHQFEFYFKRHRLSPDGFGVFNAYIPLEKRKYKNSNDNKVTFNEISGGDNGNSALIATSFDRIDIAETIQHLFDSRNDDYLVFLFEDIISDLHEQSEGVRVFSKSAVQDLQWAYMAMYKLQEQLLDMKNDESIIDVNNQIDEIKKTIISDLVTKYSDQTQLYISRIRQDEENWRKSYDLD